MLLATGLSAAQALPPQRPAAPPSPTLPSPATVNGFLRHMFGHDPSLQWQVTRIDMSPEGLAEVWVLVTTPQGQQTSRFYITPDGQHVIQGEVVPFGADPFAPARKILAQGTGPARGPVDAPLTIVEFSDLQCPHCKAAAATVEKLLADNPNARFVFQNFPLPWHDWAFKAASWADCIARESNAAFWKFAQSAYDAQESITVPNSDAKLAGLASQAGMDPAKIGACAATPETKARVEASIKLGQDAGVTGTPTLFLNGRKIGSVNGIPYDLLNRLARFQAQAGAGDQR